MGAAAEAGTAAGAAEAGAAAGAAEAGGAASAVLAAFAGGGMASVKLKGWVRPRPPGRPPAVTGADDFCCTALPCALAAEADCASAAEAD